jgi:myo-inositol-1(or 4)-monophosphatase
MAAGALLIQEAGGLVGDLGGGGEHLERGEIVAGTPKVLPQLLEALR